MNPEPDARELMAFYDSAYRGRHADVWHGLEDSANRAVIRLLKSKGVRSLVDLGAGQGRFVSMAREAGIDATGVEPVAESVGEAKTRYGVELRRAGVREYLDSHPSGVETFTMLNVLEHLADPIGILRDLRSALRPNGRLVVIVPNVDFTLALGAVRGALGFRDRYMLESSRFTQQGFDPPVHLSSFDAGHLRMALEKAGFRAEEVRHAPVIKTASPIVHLLKRGVALSGRALEIVSGGAMHWGYSLLATARPA